MGAPVPSGHRYEISRTRLHIGLGRLRRLFWFEFSYAAKIVGLITRPHYVHKQNLVHVLTIYYVRLHV